MSRNTDHPAPAIGVGALVFNSQGKVLLVERMNPPRAGEWHIPGGRLEPGESLSECCRREVREETGLEVIPRGIIAVADRRLDGFHYVIIDFLADLEEEFETTRPLQGSDALSAAWVLPEKILDLPAVEGLSEVIAAGRIARDNFKKGLFPKNSTLPWLYS